MKKTTIVCLCIALLLVLGIPGLSLGTTVVTDWAALKAEMEKGGSATLELPQTIDADSTIVIPAGADIVLCANASGSRIVRQSLKVGEFVVSAGAKLTLQGAITVAHDTNLNGASFVQVQSGGELLLEAQLTADADNVEYGNQNTDRNGEFIKSLIDCSGTLTMVAGSQVSGWTQNKQADRHNVSYDPGAAIRISGQGARFIMDGGTITGNTNTKVVNTMASSCVQILDGASFQMNGGNITGNGKGAMNGSWRDNSTLGGGVYVSGGTFTMTGGTISDNEARNGGGVYLAGASDMYMTGGSIAGNALCTRGNSGQGGGVYVGAGCIFRMESANTETPARISDNTLYTDFGLYRYYQYSGGGVYVAGTFTMKDGIISGNKALTGSGNGGGGIFNGGNVVLQGGEVRGNSAFYDENHTAYMSYGGGIFNKTGSVFSATGTKISGNTAMYGGGIYGTNADITLADCLLEGNAAIYGDMNDCGGGGLLLTRRSTLTISNTVIRNNTSEKHGGGLYLENMGTTTVLGAGVSLLGNSAASIGGGLINVASQTELSGTTVSGNQASDGAGAANMSGGSLVLSGGTVTGNAAASTGGGIVNSEATFRMTGGLIFNNLAGDAGADVANYGGSGAFTLPDAGTLGIVGVECWFEDGSADGSIPRYAGHETEVPQYVSFTENTDVHFLTLGEVLQVLFDKNGGDTEPVPARIYIRKGCPLATLPAEPTRSGHAFTGWNLAADGGGQAFVAGTAVNADLTVYAQWLKTEADPGSLTISLRVTGAGADQNADFRFTVRLQDDTINGQYGDLYFVNGTASFTLQDGESVTASGLPAGITYSVSEGKVEDYFVSATQATGTIQEGAVTTVAFLNQRDPDAADEGDEEPLPPETGDGALPYLWGGLCCLAAGLLCGAPLYAKRRRRATHAK